MAEKEREASIFRALYDPEAPWCGGGKKIAARYIDANEKLANEALALGKRATSWAKDTPWAPIFEAQESFARTLIEGSAGLARSLWRVEREEDAEKKESKARKAAGHESAA